MLEDENEAPGDSTPGAMNTANSSPGQANSVQGEQVDVAFMGENHGSIITYKGLSVVEVTQMVKELLSLGLGQNNVPLTFSPFRNGASDQYKQRLAEIVGQDLQDVALDREAAVDYQAGASDPAAMPVEIDEWYYDQLDDYERAYVIAVAVLQGATANDITRKARELYQYAIGGGSSSEQPGATGGMLSARSASRLRKKTYTVLQEGGDPRISWRSAEFGPRMLRFIAEESMEWPGSQPGQSFIDMLQNWVEELNGESARRAARMLGSILAYQSTNQLWRVANNWANQKTARYWRQAAALLNGAYEVGLSSQNAKTASTLTNSVLQLLSQWSERWLQTNNAQVACAAAYTFGLLGRHTPAIALQGLDRLLQPTQSRTSTKGSSATGSKNIFPGPLADAIVQGYVALSFSGHIRSVLSNLAATAERLVHQYQQPAQVKLYLQFKYQREAVLDLTFDAFFLIAATSLSAATPTSAREYRADEALPEEPALPDRNGRDILLAGLLASDETVWRDDLTTLLCAAMIEEKSKPALDLLQQWALVVLGQPQDRIGAFYAQFVTFMINLGKTLRLWCGDFASKGLNRSSALQAYQSRLTAWQQEGRKQANNISALANYVLRRMNE